MSSFVHVYKKCYREIVLQESYSLLAKYQISVAREEADKVDTFRFAWQKLNTLAVSSCT